MIRPLWLTSLLLTAASCSSAAAYFILNYLSPPSPLPRPPPSPLSNLPPDLFSRILSYLEPRSLARSEATSFTFFRGSRSPTHRHWSTIYAQTGLGRLSRSCNDRDALVELLHLRFPSKVPLDNLRCRSFTPLIRTSVVSGLALSHGINIESLSLEMLEVAAVLLFDCLIAKVVAHTIVLPLVTVNSYEFTVRAEWRFRGSFQTNDHLPNIGDEGVLRYFETTIKEAGPGIAIGFSEPGCQGYGYLPGLEPLSCAIFNHIGVICERRTLMQSPVFLNGDVLGAGHNDRQFFFTLNGAMLPNTQVDIPVGIAALSLRPCIGFFSGKVAIAVNLGWSPFRYEDGIRAMM